MKVSKRILLFLLIPVVHAVFFYFIYDFKIIQDEYFHFNQISRYLAGDYSLNPAMTTLPGYHILVAAILKIIHSDSLANARLITFVLNLSSIAAFYLTVNLLDRKSAVIKTLQFSFFPLVFPYFSLVYTDIFSISMVLFSFYFILIRRYNLSGIMGIASLLVRQNNVIWLVFFLISSYIRENGNNFHLINIFKHLKKSWLLASAVVTFVVFAVIHKGFSLGVQEMFPVKLFNMGNIYLLLFIFFVLFLPENILRLKKISWNLKGWRNFLILAGAGFIFFMKTMVNTHPFNQTWWFIHNYLIILFNSTLHWKIIYYLVIITSLVILKSTELIQKGFVILYPLVVLSLLPFWMVEYRYYMIPFTLFILFAKAQTPAKKIICHGVSRLVSQKNGTACSLISRSTNTLWK